MSYGLAPELGVNARGGRVESLEMGLETALGGGRGKQRGGTNQEVAEWSSKRQNDPAGDAGQPSRPNRQDLDDRGSSVPADAGGSSITAPNKQRLNTSATSSPSAGATRWNGGGGASGKRTVSPATAQGTENEGEPSEVDRGWGSS